MDASPPPPDGWEEAGRLMAALARLRAQGDPDLAERERQLLRQLDDVLDRTERQLGDLGAGGR